MQQSSLSRCLLALFAVSISGVITTFLLLLRTQSGTRIFVYDTIATKALRVQCQILREDADQVERETQGDNTSNWYQSDAKEVSEVEQDETDEPVTRGYMVALKHFEQQTQALKNYLQLQCLANSYGMRTVEPFLDRSFLSFPFDTLLRGGKVPVLGDLIDVDLWNNQTKAMYGYPAMTKWEEFLRSAPKNLVIGCVRYQNPTNLHVPLPGSNYRLGCPTECFKGFNASVQFLNRYGFTVVREACINFYDYAGSVTTESVLENLLLRNKPNETTILLNQFRGFFGLYRLPILSECGIIHHHLDVSVMPSASIMRDSRKYINRYYKDKKYIAILVRMERLVLHLHQNMTKCTGELMTILEELHTQRNLPRNYFLAMDVGAFGSQVSARNHLLPYGKSVFNSVFKDTWTFREWEESFKSIFAPNGEVDSAATIVSDDAGRVANVQRVVAASSECLIMFGGGGFQAQSREYYDQHHTDPDTYCVRKLCINEALGRDSGSQLHLSP